MSEMFVAGEEVVNTMKDLVAKYHPHLALVVDEIAVVFKEKATQVGDVVITGKSSKAPAILQTLSEVNWKFILLLAADQWKEMSDKERLALLDHHLCACRAEENEETQETRYFIQPPDVEFYREEIERHGFWRTSGEPAPKNLIMELFGEPPKKGK